MNHASDAVPLASGIRQLFATCSLHPFSNSRLLPFARPSASSISATGHFPTFVVCDRPLLDWNSRSRLASEQVFQPARLRRNCGPQSNVSGIHLLSKISALKLRLERFRTSHARVIRNLLLSQIRASEMEGIFVTFLFKTCTSCGVGWKRCGGGQTCTICGGKISCIRRKAAKFRALSAL